MLCLTDEEVENFWSNVDKSNRCWEWQLYRNKDGYGQAYASGKQPLAHRVSWELENGPIPDGLCVLHRCDNPPCVRPGHLFLGTHAVNMNDMKTKGRAARRYGETNSQCKITDLQVQQIRKRYVRGVITQSQVAEEFGVSQANVSFIVNHVWRKTA